MRRKTHPGFTLVELMVVITIIAILAAISFSVYRAIRIASDRKIAKSDLARINQAMSTYNRCGHLPSPGPLDPMTASVKDYENAPVIKQLNGIMNRQPLLKVGNSERNAAGSFKDPWGTPYRIVIWKRKPADKVYNAYALYSCAQDLKWEYGNGDDIAAP